MKLRLLFSLLGALTSLACEGRENKPAVAPPPIDPPTIQIGQAEAKRLAARRYRELFDNKYYFDSSDRTYHAMPAVDQADFRWVESRGSWWLVMTHQPVGLDVEARVAKDGSWTELVRAHWASD